VNANWLPPLGIAIPLLGACLVLAVARVAPRLVVDVLAMTAAVATTAAMTGLLLVSMSGRVVTWVGGWTPNVGIVLAADPIGAVFALLTCALTVCALSYTWRYFEDAEAHVHVLILLFTAGMVGFSLTGDLFDLFVSSN